MILHKYKVDKSIIVAGIKSTGKSRLIEELQKYSRLSAKGRRRQRPVPLLHREQAEVEGIPLNTFVHWPIAEKYCDADKASYDNVGLVILLSKCWDDYCNNVMVRGQPTQYSPLGFEQICKQWEEFFTEKGLPILFIERNDVSMAKLISDIAHICHGLSCL